MNQQQYNRSLAEIQNSSLSSEHKLIAIGLLKQRAIQEYYANKADSSGFSKADKNAVNASQLKLVQEAMSYGLPEQIAQKWPISELRKYIDYKKPRKIVYDESELA